MYRRGAEQGATDFEEGPNQARIGCLLFSLNPPLLKEMSGNLFDQPKFSQGLTKHRQCLAEVSLYTAIAQLDLAKNCRSVA